MSFSTDVKTELSSLKHLDCCNKAELSALFHIGGSIELNSEGLSILFQSTNLAVVRTMMRHTKNLFNVELTLISKKQTKLKKHDLYVVQVSTHAEKILSELSLLNQNGLFFQDVDANLIENECCKKAYLRGAFLAGGSINNPDTSTYHLEIQTFSEKQAEVIKKIANEFDLKAKTTKNRRGYIVYIKEAEKISDFLRVTDAINSLFTFEDNRIKRDFRNSINRVINCDIANERKAMDAAKKQLEHIEIIEKKMKDKLPKSIEEAIFLRKKYPESTLLELSYASIEFYQSQISKSALNHRFRAIKDLANQLMIEEKNK